MQPFHFASNGSSNLGYGNGTHTGFGNGTHTGFGNGAHTGFGNGTHSAGFGNTHRNDAAGLLSFASNYQNEDNGANGPYTRIRELE
jgi:hypothetical protein